MGATRLNDVFRATVVNRNQPHATETLSFWQHILDDDLADLIRRHYKVIMPEASQGVRDKSIVAIHV